MLLLQINYSSWVSLCLYNLQGWRDEMGKSKRKKKDKQIHKSKVIRDTPFLFSRTDQVGSADAESDKEFLSQCFVDTGDLELLTDVSDQRQIILGRTGAGKSALLSQLSESIGEHIIKISPENLALTYVSNSTILQFFSTIGVNLDPFFKLLWRHVLTVEVLKRHFDLHESIDSSKKNVLLERLYKYFSDNRRESKEMKVGIDYLKKWGEEFWQETEYRVKEITNKVESELGAQVTAELGTPLTSLRSSLSAAEKLTNEERAELVSRGQSIISKAQVQDLHKVIMIIDSILEDRQKPYYIVVDDLDLNWVEEKLRYKLIMALIQTSRDFIKVRNAKVVIALRRDLIERVFRLTRDSGFQEEKYQSLYLPLKWHKTDLIAILDQRIKKLVKSRSEREDTTHKDLLPKKYLKTNITDYLVARAERPRDIITFFNFCISAGNGLPRLRTQEFRKAEVEYSRSRLRALADEWSADYPYLSEFAKILQQRPASFKLATIMDTEVEDLCLGIAAEHPYGADYLSLLAMRLADCLLIPSKVKCDILQVFYRIGLVGLKVEVFEDESWVDEFGRGVARADIDENTSVIVHPAYHRALGIKP